MKETNANAADKDTVVDDARLTEASEWFVRLREADASSEIITAWVRWCNDDPENARAYRQIQEIWSLAKDAGVGEWPNREQVRSDQYMAEIPIAEWNQVQSQRDRCTVPRQAGSHRARAYVFAAAASFVLAIGTVSITQYWKTSPTVYATERAAKREIRLADGSTVRLGGASTIRVTYGADHRDVELDSGEAHFRVTPDRARPFIVRAQDLRVTAVGTAFTVRADDVRTVVSVTDGIVDVAGANAATYTVQAVRAGAGEQVTYDAQRGTSIKQPSDEAIALGWQDGALSYVDEPLRAVIARVNRNSTSEIVLADPELGELRFTGTVHENQVSEWARSLERVFPVRVVTSTDGHLTLEPR